MLNASKRKKFMKKIDGGLCVSCGDKMPKSELAIDGEGRVFKEAIKSLVSRRKKAFSVVKMWCDKCGQDSTVTTKE